MLPLDLVCIEVIASSHFSHFGFYERFHEHLLLSDSEGNLYL